MSRVVETAGNDLRPEQFNAIAQLLYRQCGINLGPGKDSLVKSRLTKRLRNLGLPGFSEYLAYLNGDRSGQELRVFVDSLTTNKTSFFREVSHFEFLRREVFPSYLSRGG